MATISIIESRLTELEQVISHGLQTFVEVGNALKEIRDSRLYRQAHGTFEDYCSDRWGFSREYGRLLISSAQVSQQMATIVGKSPATESQARELGRIKDTEERQEVWQQVTEEHEPQEITAKVIRETVETRQEESSGEEPTEPPAERPYIHTETFEVSHAMTFAEMAIRQLERIRSEDPKRKEGLLYVSKWISGHIKGEN